MTMAATIATQRALFDGLFEEKAMEWMIQLFSASIGKAISSNNNRNLVGANERDQSTSNRSVERVHLFLFLY